MILRRERYRRSRDPVKIERDLMELLPKREWVMFSHRVIHHGRRICNARRPDCESCCFSGKCPRIGVELPIKAAGV